MTRRRRTLPLGVLLLVCACSSGTAPQRSAPGPLRVAASTAPITSIVAEIGGDRVEVTGLLPEGLPSHDAAPPPAAADAVARADLVLVNGLGLDEPVLELARARAPRTSLVVQLGPKVLLPSRAPADPHLWLDPIWAARYSDVVRDLLVAADPPGEAAYVAAHRDWVGRATDLNEAMKAGTATVAPERRLLLTQHGAFAHFARRYGWRVVGALESLTPAQREEARRLPVRSVHGSVEAPGEVPAQVAEQLGARLGTAVREVDLPGLPGGGAHSWLGLLREDFVRLVEGAGGDASALRALDVAAVPEGRATYPAPYGA